jgi:lipid II:glycine glycyltransferase (peptidoglycan interpeptide bridge formation enzyme)
MYLTEEEWKQTLGRFPEAHLLQFAEWGELKSGFGWKPVWLSSGNCCAQILFKSLPAGMSIGYIPKGPLGTPDQVFWRELQNVGREHGAVMIKIEPDYTEDFDQPVIWPDAPPQLVPSNPIQPAQTILLDLIADEKTIQDNMKQKTRYNIHLAEKKEINIVPSRDVRAFYELMIRTGNRDRFGIHSFEYYRRAFDLFSPKGQSSLLIARYNGVDLAAVMLFKAGHRCWYFYGASTEIERNRMPVYLLQWDAIRWAKNQGCTVYDLWGIPDYPEEILEEQFINRSDGLWGVYRFKRGFGGRIVRSPQTVDLVIQPLLYKLLMWWTNHRSRGVEYG